jgi:hypothetical protein
VNEIGASYFMADVGVKIGTRQNYGFSDKKSGSFFVFGGKLPENGFVLVPFGVFRSLVLVANCKTAHDSNLHSHDSKRAFFIRHQYLIKCAYLLDNLSDKAAKSVSTMRASVLAARVRESKGTRVCLPAAAEWFWSAHVFILFGVQR